MNRENSPSKLTSAKKLKIGSAEASPAVEPIFREQQSPTTGGKPHLADYMSKELSSLFPERAYLREAAKQFRIGYDALRKDIQKNTFSPETIKAFCSFARIDEETIKNTYHYKNKSARNTKKEMEKLPETINFVGMHERLEQWIDQAFQVDCVAHKIIPNLFKALGNESSGSVDDNINSVFIFVGEESPSYMEPTTTANEMIPYVLKALKSGASICHLCLSSSAFMWNLGGGVPKSSKDLETSISIYHKKISLGEKENVPKNIWVLEHEHPQLVAPCHRYVLYMCNQGIFSTLTVPVMGHWAKNSSSWPIVPLASQLTLILRDIVVEAISIALIKKDIKPLSKLKKALLSSRILTS